MKHGLPGSLAGELGQATLEYILLIIIVLIITLSMLYQFHDSFRIYAEAFFDGYIRCLLEVGELPGTGSLCAQEFTAFNAKSGKTLLKDNLPNDPGGGGGGGKKVNTPTKVATGGRETKSGGGGGGTAPIGRFGGGRGAASVPMGKLEGSDTYNGNKESLQGAANTVPVGRFRSSNGNQLSSTIYTTDEEVEGGKEQKPKEVTSTKKVVAGGDSLRASKVPERPYVPRPLKDSGESSFTLGGLIRFILILLIIVALVIFFGGQLMQISKSREKGGD